MEEYIEEMIAFFTATMNPTKTTMTKAVYNIWREKQTQHRCQQTRQCQA